MHKFIVNIIVLQLLLLASCGSDEGTLEPLRPTNLELVVTKSKNTEGKISISATADNANFYDFDFGEIDTQPIVDNDGSIEYTYQSPGDYKITVRAFATLEVYIEKETSVNIEIDESADIPTDGYTTPMAYDGYNMVWNDEFDGSSLSSYWTFEIGTGSNGWGNNELQYYRQENTNLSDGYLTIEAKEESFSGQDYTSSRIVTEGKKSFKYGRVDIRAVLPEGKGLWPALWMLGANFSTVGWPYCGEIDIMEKIGGVGLENMVHGTVHWDNDGAYASYGDSYSVTGGSLKESFHVFTLIWDANTIKWYVDDVLYNTIDITPTDLNEFQQDFFIIFNVAVGGNWPGSPDNTTTFPQRMIVDYIRVFQK